MIYVIATLTLEPGARGKTIAAAEPCIAATREEPGCLRYELNTTTDNENQVIFVEKWKTREDLQLHFGRPHMSAWREASAPFITDRQVEVIHAGEVEKL